MSVPIKQLAALIASNEERFSGAEYVRGESANFLVFEEHPDELQDVLDRVILCQPGRLFKLRYSSPSSPSSPSSLADLKAEITADLKIAQHKIATEVSLWNEEILISSSKESWGRVPSVLRSFIISSAPLYAILTGRQQLNLFSKLGVKVDWVIIDSGKDPRLLQELHNLRPVVSKGIIDLQWLALAQARELIRREFDSDELRHHLGLIRRVEIDSATSVDCSSPLLMAGWIAHCLGADPMSLGPWGIECRRGSEPTLNISFSPSVLVELQTFNRFRAKEQGEMLASQIPPPTEVSLDLRIRFEDADGGLIARFQHSIEQSSNFKAGLVERYFLLGESVANYVSSARRALEILRLQQAYEVNEIVGEDW